MQKPLIYIIDPQSVNSLGVYDYEMIYGIRNFDIHFFGNSRYNHRPFNENVKFSGIFSYGKYSSSILKGLSYALSIIRIMLRGVFERPQIMHFQWTRIFSLDYLMVRWFQAMCGTKVVFTVHNILPRKQKKTTFGDFKKLYNKCDILIAHTETCRNELIERFDLCTDKIVVMPHGCLDLEVAEAELKEVTESFVDTYDLRGKFIFSSLGSQHSYKGTDLLLDAWINTKEISENDDIRLILAGNTSNIEIPEDLPENLIVIPRLLSNSEFKSLVCLTDVSLLPYRAIEQSGVLLTLIQNCIPYCCTKVGELTKPIEMASVGWIIEDVTSRAISKCLKSILIDKEGARLKKRNPELWNQVKKEYSWEKSNRILEEAYLSLLPDLNP